ncbi:glycosyltransferase family 9 protein [Ferrigenium sp. UT5]|uniref:glycosyltransferase family 9 protein n=1 Tax=Ferrigenium sp. UT5 TaxID=3242105 RepID=UPI0038B24163
MRPFFLDFHSSRVLFPADSPVHIAVVRFSALGDVVMVAAAVRALRHAWPAATITWITSPLAYALLQGMDGVDFVVIDKPRSLIDYCTFYRLFRGRRFDVVLAMQANLRINLLYPALHAPLKIGFDRTRAREGQWLFCNRHIPFRDTHLVDSFLSFVETLTEEPAVATWELPLNATDIQWAKVQLQSLIPDRGTSAVSPVCWIAIHPNASKAERNWLPDRYATLIERATARWDCGVLLTGGNTHAELKLCEQLAHIAPERTRNLCGKTTPKQLAALLGEADVLLAPDTGSVHIARAMDTPVVGLYAVASPKLTGPYQQAGYCVDRYSQAVGKFMGKNPEQLPWNTRVHHMDAMALIGVEEVLLQLARVLEKAPHHAAPENGQPDEGMTR